MPSYLWSASLKVKRVRDCEGWERLQKKRKGPRNLWAREMALGFHVVAEVPGSCFFQEHHRKQRRPDSGKSFIASRMAAQDGCHSLDKVLEPHFPLVQAKGRTQGPYSLIAEIQNSCQVGQSRLVHCLVDQLGGVAGGGISIRLGQASPPELSSSLCLSQGLFCWLK